MAKAKKEKKEKAETTAADDIQGEEKIIPISEGAEATGKTDEGEPREEPAEDLANEIDQLKAQVQQLEDQKLRVLADLDNFRKRSVRQLQDAVHHANDRLLGEILEVVDNFERALQHQDGNAEDANGEAVLQGTQLIYNQMIDLLGRYDVKVIEALGQPFDPNLHEALMPVASDEYDDGTVAVEISKGYMQGERVLRHAKVGVSKGPEKDPETDADEAPEKS